LVNSKIVVISSLFRYTVDSHCVLVFQNKVPLQLLCVSPGVEINVQIAQGYDGEYWERPDEKVDPPCESEGRLGIEVASVDYWVVSKASKAGLQNIRQYRKIKTESWQELRAM
jgi:hypothetical protein